MTWGQFPRRAHNPHSDCSNFLQDSNKVGTTQIPQQWISYSSLYLMEQVRFTKLLLWLLLVWVGNRHQKVAYKKEADPNQTEATGLYD